MLRALPPRSMTSSGDDADVEPRDPKGQRLELHPREWRAAAHQLREIFAARKAGRRRFEIFVRLALARDCAAEAGEEMRAVEVVERADDAAARLPELQHHHPPSRPYHTGHLRDTLHRIGDVADAKRDARNIEAV